MVVYWHKKSDDIGIIKNIAIALQSTQPDESSPVHNTCGQAFHSFRIKSLAAKFRALMVIVCAYGVTT
jgi:hypothetical protein